MGVFCAILAILVFAVLGITYKLSGKPGCNQHHINLFMFLSASMATLLWGTLTGQMAFVRNALILGGSMGLMAYFSVLIFRKAATMGRISTSWTVLNLALIIPVLASILIWGESPAPKHWIGLGLTMVAITLLGYDIGREGE